MVKCRICGKEISKGLDGSLCLGCLLEEAENILTEIAARDQEEQEQRRRASDEDMMRQAYEEGAMITKEVMQQYEEVRQSGACNMLDVTCVAQYAELAGFNELLVIVRSRKEYSKLLQNFSSLMAEHGITQRSKEAA